ncbi:hypothetical protein SeMB42_g06829 [Synchytrium endobioticum]|uniref:DNA replication checkpoint mediator MRC1 domain-containing protein n=1 Tax=Synchytrium endobioticum TaxID=286115 RepID=A0A507CID4_9FUNG|nr:hypothetical protein SeMB42_g06829 [Synchytrium endobioticum]
MHGCRTPESDRHGTPTDAPPFTTLHADANQGEGGPTTSSTDDAVLMITDSDGHEIPSTSVKQTVLQQVATQQATLDSKMNEDQCLVVTKPVKRGSRRMNDLLKRFGYGAGFPNASKDHPYEQEERANPAVYHVVDNDKEMLDWRLPSPPPQVISSSRPISPKNRPPPRPISTAPPPKAKSSAKLAAALTVDKFVPITDAASIVKSNRQTARLIHAQPDDDDDHDNGDIELEIVHLIEHSATRNIQHVIPTRQRSGATAVPFMVRSTHNPLAERAKRNAELKKVGDEQLKRERDEEKARRQKTADERRALKEARRKERQAERVAEEQRRAVQAAAAATASSTNPSGSRENADGEPLPKRQRLDQTDGANDMTVTSNHQSNEVQGVTDEDGIDETLKDTRGIHASISKCEDVTMSKDKNATENEDDTESQMELFGSKQLEPGASDLMEDDGEHHLGFLEKMTQDPLPSDSQLLEPPTPFAKDFAGADTVIAATDTCAVSNSPLQPTQDASQIPPKSKFKKQSRPGGLDRFFNTTAVRDKERGNSDNNSSNNKAAALQEPGSNPNILSALLSGNLATQGKAEGNNEGAAENIMDLLSGKFESPADSTRLSGANDNILDLLSGRFPTQQAEPFVAVLPENQDDVVDHLMLHDDASRDVDDSESHTTQGTDDDDDDGDDGEESDDEPARIVLDEDAPAPMYNKRKRVIEESSSDNDATSDTESDGSSGGNDGNETNERAGNSEMKDDIIHDVAEDEECEKTQIILLPGDPRKDSKAGWDDVFNRPMILQEAKPKSAFIDTEAEEEDDEFKGAGGVDGDVEDEDYGPMSGDDEKIEDFSQVIDLFHKQQAAADKKMFDTLLEDVTAGGMSRRRRDRGGDERGVGWDTDSESDDEIRRFKARHRMNGLFRSNDDGSEWAKLAKDPKTKPFAACFDESALWGDSDEEEQIETVSASTIRGELMRVGSSLSNASLSLRRSMSVDLDEYEDEEEEHRYDGSKSASKIESTLSKYRLATAGNAEEEGDADSELIGSDRRLTSAKRRDSRVNDAPQMPFDVVKVIRDRNKADRRGPRAQSFQLGGSYMSRTLVATKNSSMQAQKDVKLEMKVSRMGSGGLDGEVSKTAKRMMAFQVYAPGGATNDKSSSGRLASVKETAATKPKVLPPSSQTGRLLGFLARSNGFA